MAFEFNTFSENAFEKLHIKIVTKCEFLPLNIDSTELQLFFQRTALQRHFFATAL